MVSRSRSASSVVGNLLMVAITIIIAVPVVLLGLTLVGGLGEVPPTAQFETFESETGVGLVHVAGDELRTDNLHFQFDQQSVPATRFTDTETITAGTRMTFQPRGAESIQVVWEADTEETAILHTVESYTSTAVFQYTGESKQLDTSHTQSVTVEVIGAGGESVRSLSGELDSSLGGAGGYVNGTLDVATLDELTLYVGESPNSTPVRPVGGWGWQDGGAPASTSVGTGGGGGGSTAIVADETPLVIAHGGGGGADYDTYSFAAGGGGGGGGDGGWNGFGTPTEDAESGEGTGKGGDGAGGPAGNENDRNVTQAFNPATDGGAEIPTPELVIDGTTVAGGGSPPGQDGIIRVTYSVGKQD